MRVLMQIYLLLVLCASARTFGKPEMVYLIVGSDTAIWNYGNTVDVYTRHPHYSQASFTDPASPIFQIMDPAWRSQFKDSFGQPLKFTWWLMGGNIYRDADNVNVPVANTMVPYLMKKYHGDAIRQFGDELSIHYHTFFWSDYTGSGTYYWNQSQTFEECRADFDYTLAQYLLEEDIFPVSFRSGWHYMDNDWQAYLNDLLPYCMHDNWPAYQPWYWWEPINNVQNWSKAPSTFVPFHPATTNYQVPGDGKGWDLRSIKMQSMAQRDMDSIFAKASNGVAQVACIWSHLPEAFAPNFARIDQMAHLSESNHPGVLFRYCTAIEGMQLWQGLTNQSPPQIDVTETVQGQFLTLTIHSSVPLFQPRPFVAMRDVFQQVSNVTALCSLVASNTWQITFPCAYAQLSKVGIAATDPAGNLATKIIRYLPDDLYLDNLDSQYTEPSGEWVTTTNAAWGIDSRAVMLSSNGVARARWNLPITRSGLYDVAIQVPAVGNAASNIMYDVVADSVPIYSRHFTNALPGFQWIDLGSVFLNASQTNYLSVSAPASGQQGTWAVADVARVIPLPDPPFNTLTVISVDPGGCKLLYTGQPGSQVQLQRSADLNNWSTIASLNLSTNGVAAYIETNSPPTAAFYRCLKAP